MLACSDGMSAEELSQTQKTGMLAVDKSQFQRLVVRRKHVCQDALCRFQKGLDFHKHIHVIFVAEPAVDEGGPLRGFLHLLMGAIATNNNLFQGENHCRVPAPNMAELQKHTYHYVGRMMAVSLIHGGPSPVFLATSVVNYIFYGISKVRATVNEVPIHTIKSKLKEVGACGT